MRQRLEQLLFADESPLAFAATRIVLAATALWMVLSRPSLPEVLRFPPEMWAGVSAIRRARFLYVFPFEVEQVLWFSLHIALVAALIGLAPRISMFVSALLLYHFAPLETVLWTPNPYLRGFTLPILGLLVLSFVPRKESRRWPLLLIQIFIVQVYFFAGYAKLFTSGLAWIDGNNIRLYLLLLNQYLGFPKDSLAYWFADQPLLCTATAWIAVLFDLAFPVILFWPRSRRVMIPLAILFHIANAVLFRVMFQNTVLLLLFVNWDWVAARLRQFRVAKPPAAAAPEIAA